MLQTTAFAAILFGLVALQPIAEKTSCRETAQKAINSNLVGAFIPKCQPDGSFLSLQCYGSTGACWCVDEYGKKVPENLIQKTKCNNPCFKKVLENQLPSILVHGAPQPIDMGISAPDCDATGYYKPKQCDQKSCWCVDKQGNEFKHTRGDVNIVCE